jgi:hypothetical protein
VTILPSLSDPNPYPSNNKNGNNIIHKITRGDEVEEKAKGQTGRPINGG